MCPPPSGRIRGWLRRHRASEDVQLDQGTPIVDHAAVKALVNRLDLPVPFDVVELCTLFGQQRGKPIEVMPYPRHVIEEAEATGAALPYAALMLGKNIDAILYDPALTLRHRRHVVLHELGHAVCGHQPASIADGMVLRRTTFHSDQEVAAELFAYLMIDRGDGRMGMNATSTDPAYRDVVGRYELLED